jgi:purine nucleoside permease
MYTPTMQPYLVREKPPVKSHFGVVPQALEDGSVARDVDISRIVDLRSRKSFSRLQVEKTDQRQSFRSRRIISPIKKYAVHQVARLITL